MSELRPPPSFKLLASLRSSARWIFLALAIDLLSNLIVYSGVLPGLEPAPAEGDAAAFTQKWATRIRGVAYLVVLVMSLRFAWPLLDTRGAPAGLLDPSLRRMAVLWRVLGVVVLLGLLAVLGLVALVVLAMVLR